MKINIQNLIASALFSVVTGSKFDIKRTQIEYDGQNNQLVVKQKPAEPPRFNAVDEFFDAQNAKKGQP